MKSMIHNVSISIQDIPPRRGQNLQSQALTTMLLITASVSVTHCVQLFATTWLLCPWTSPGKNSGVACHSLLQGIFLTQGLNPRLLHCRFFTI